jgi:hypothetical protein
MSYFPEKTFITTVNTSACKTLNTVPVLLVPGVAGCIVDIKACLIRYNPGTTPFNPNWNSTVDLFELYTGGGTAATSFANYGIACAGFVDQTVSEMAFLGNWWAPTLGIPLSDVEGQGIYLIQYDSNNSLPTGTNWTQGNGSLTVFTRAAYIVA